MKAAIYTKYGPPDVVKITEVPKPVPKPDQVLVKIYASAVNSSDWRMRSATFPRGFGLLARLGLGIFCPRNQILGAELSGVVEAVGANVTRFQPGDRVFAGGAFGGHAEYKVVKQTKLAKLPKNLSFAQGAALSFGGATAIYFLHDLGRIQPGEHVLVNGASGTTGLAAIQIAKQAGATVTAVCRPRSFEIVRAVGADQVIDYTVTDFAKSGTQYDIIFDAAGTAPWHRAKHALHPTGRLLIVIGSLWAMIQAPFVSRKNGKRAISGTSIENAQTLERLASLAENGQFTPVIDRQFAFKDIVGAHAYVDTGHKQGSVVVLISEDMGFG